MDEEESPEEQSKLGRNKLIVLMAVLFIVGLGLYLTPIFVYPDVVVHEAALTESNSHTTHAQLDLDKGNYEVWMSRSLWSFFNLDQPLVSVNDSTGQSLHVDYRLGGDDRNIDGIEARHFATFRINERATYNVSVTAALMSLGIPGSEQVFIVEERPALYAPMQWTGILMMVVGIIGFLIIMVMIAFTSSEERKERMRKAPPPGTYPPPQYPQYQQPQQPPAGYGQYPPQQPPYQPPPPSYPQYPPPQQPPPGQAPRRPPPY
jgi:hypothetical protein